MPDPTQIAKTGDLPEFHPERQDAVADLDDFGKIIEEIVSTVEEGVSETKDKEKKKAEKEAKESILSKAKAYGLLESQSTRTAEAKDAHIKQPGPPGGPKLPVPKLLNSLREVPSDDSGTGNPWLQSSLAAELFLVWFELLPILLQIKLKEAETQSDMIKLQQEAAVNAAEQAFRAKKSEAKKMQLEAIKHFINAGIQMGMVAGMFASRIPARKLAGKAWRGAGKTFRAARHPMVTARNARTAMQQKAKSLKTGFLNNFKTGGGTRINKTGSAKGNQPALNRNKAFEEQQRADLQRVQAGSGDDIDTQADIHRGQLRRAGDEMPDDLKPGYASKAGRAEAGEHMRSIRTEAFLHSLTSINEGVFEMLKIEHVLAEGEANYLQQAWQHLTEVIGRAIQYAEREGKQASDQISDLIQAINQFIQHEQAFRIHRGG